jgi:hypothetical protein
MSKRRRVHAHLQSASVLIQWPLLLQFCSSSSTSGEDERFAQQPNLGRRGSFRHRSLGDAGGSSSVPPRLRLFLVRLLARAVLSGYTFLWKICRICKWVKRIPFLEHTWTTCLSFIYKTLLIEVLRKLQISYWVPNIFYTKGDLVQWYVYSRATKCFFVLKKVHFLVQLKAKVSIISMRKFSTTKSKAKVCRLIKQSTWKVSTRQVFKKKAKDKMIKHNVPSRYYWIGDCKQIMMSIHCPRF